MQIGYVERLSFELKLLLTISTAGECVCLVRTKSLTRILRTTQQTEESILMKSRGRLEYEQKNKESIKVV